MNHLLGLSTFSRRSNSLSLGSWQAEMGRYETLPLRFAPLPSCFAVQPLPAVVPTVIIEPLPAGRYFI